METVAEGFKGEKAIVTPYNVRELQAENIITRQLYVTHIGYYPNAKYHYRERTTGAPENILIYCEKGKGWVECFGEKNYLSAQQVFIIPENEPHSYAADPRNPWTIYWIHFKGNSVKMFEAIIGKTISLESRHQERIMLFESIFENLEMGYYTDNLEYISFCLMYFLASIRYQPQYMEVRDFTAEDVIRKSILYMKNNIENRLTLSDLADFAGYSVSRLIALFTQKTSYAPMEYYNQLRIQRACSYLQFSKLKIKEIAFRLGFYDPFHFSKAFLKEMGITPKTYRGRYNERGIFK
ncbi:MAG: AraC family transcriptional regulator [Dysgonamonadaceae bacterium]|jgi:AraC-like DNA-binding protein|nr:AraC family transcriptional regulator [Dysgonamonadaceae bacterium]